MNQRTVNPSHPGTFHEEIAAGETREDQLVASFLGCPRVSKILSTIAWRHRLHDNEGLHDLRTETWMRLRVLLERLDEPKNVYSLIWRVAELASLELTRTSTRTEALAEVELDNDASDESDEGAQNLAMELAADIRLARSAFAEKLKRVGWPSGSSRAMKTPYTEVRRPGRPRKTEG